MQHTNANANATVNANAYTNANPPTMPFFFFSLQDAFPYDFLSGSKALSAFEKFICDVTLGITCKISVDFICGTSDEDDKDVIDNRFVVHFPAGAYGICAFDHLCI